MKWYSRILTPIVLTVAIQGLSMEHAYGETQNPAPPNKPPSETMQTDVYAERKDLFDKVSVLTGVPWHYLAAVDQYERALSKASPKKRPPREGLIGIFISDSEWAGPLNPDTEDQNPVSIALFNGFGKDGSGDGKADRGNDLDVLYSMTSHLLKHGLTPDDFLIGVWEYYHNTRAVERVEQFSKLYEAFGTLKLDDHAFPLPLKADYSYRSTWGAARSWGGYRIHEGTDIFARYGVPVRSTAYGIVEVKGWNPYGGWRVGIRDIHNVYHYFGHLAGFAKGLKKGDLVEPGQVIGWVGSSGYGKPGTQGRFPPHLHYGMYRDFGLVDWSFDPYPHLKRWERNEYKKLRASRK